MKPQDIGQLGEKVALNFLLKQNYSLIKKNYRIQGGEIDLIMQDLTTQEIVFIEVKTSTANQNYFPEERIGYRKKKLIIHAAKVWLLENLPMQDEYRIDVLSVVLHTDFKSAEVRHFVNAIYEESSLF